MRMGKQIGAALLGILLFTATVAIADVPQRPLGRVSDYANVLNEKDKDKLDGLLEYIKKATGAEIAVVTVRSLEGKTVETYALDLFHTWGIGKKGEDNGVLFLVAPQDRKVRIEVGYGLEPVLTDGRAGRILDNDVLPSFKQGEYGQGIINGCAQIMSLLLNKDAMGREANLPQGSRTSPSSLAQEELPLGGKIGIMLFFSIFITLGFLALGSGLGKGGEPFFIVWGAGFGGIPMVMSIIFGLFMGFPIYILPLWGTAMFLVGLKKGTKFMKKAMASGATATVNGRTYSGGGSHFGSFSSGSSFGGFGGGSSFGGFSGGSSGGGGSSRSW